MSADNGVYILKTTDSGEIVYRVAHAQAIENFDWYKERDPENFPGYLKDIWGKSPVFTSEEEAKLHAVQVHRDCGYTEYGIDTIDALDINFPV